MSLEPRITALIRSFSAATNRTDDLIFDGPAIARAMSTAPGIVSVLLRNTAPAAIEGTIQISELNEFLAAAEISQGVRRRFIAFEQGICEIYINRENGPVILGLLSPDITDYLNALMAPIATGENMSKTEYLELVSSFYNRTISDEIAGSRVRASIDFPGTITNVKGGTFSGRRAEFNIPLLDLMVLETPMVFEVQWR
jgi:hypothetical protein